MDVRTEFSPLCSTGHCLLLGLLPCLHLALALPLKAGQWNRWPLDFRQLNCTYAVENLVIYDTLSAFMKFENFILFQIQRIDLLFLWHLTLRLTILHRKWLWACKTWFYKWYILKNHENFHIFQFCPLTLANLELWFCIEIHNMKKQRILRPGEFWYCILPKNTPGAFELVIFTSLKLPVPYSFCKIIDVTKSNTIPNFQLCNYHSYPSSICNWCAAVAHMFSTKDGAIRKNIDK